MKAKRIVAFFLIALVQIGACLALVGRNSVQSQRIERGGEHYRFAIQSVTSYRSNNQTFVNIIYPPALPLPEAEYVALLSKLAVGASVSGDEEIVLNARDKKAVGDKLIKAANAKLGGGHLSLAGDTGSFRGGLILRRGNIEVNCTAELLVDLCREDMAAELAGVLFG